MRTSTRTGSARAARADRISLSARTTDFHASPWIRVLARERGLDLVHARELLDANRTMTVTAQDGTLFAAPGTNLPRGYLTTGASVTLHPTKNLDVSLNYDTVINTGHASAQQGSVHLGYQF